MLELQDGPQPLDFSALIGNTSDVDSTTIKQGKVFDTHNIGSVEGGRKFGGLIGAISIEFA